MVSSQDCSYGRSAKLRLGELALELFLVLVHVECGRAGGLWLDHFLHELLNLLSDLDILPVKHLLIEQHAIILVNILVHFCNDLVDHVLLSTLVRLGALSRALLGKPVKVE